MATISLAAAKSRHTTRCLQAIADNEAAQNQVEAQVAILLPRLQSEWERIVPPVAQSIATSLLDRVAEGDPSPCVTRSDWSNEIGFSREILTRAGISATAQVQYVDDVAGELASQARPLLADALLRAVKTAFLNGVDEKPSDALLSVSFATPFDVPEIWATRAQFIAIVQVPKLIANFDLSAYAPERPRANGATWLENPGATLRTL